MFPALVGMNRAGELHPAIQAHVPRTRGDEPSGRCGP